MKARVWVPLLLAVALGWGGWKLYEWRSQPPEVPFTHATLETIASVVPTNGKVEPIEWATARAERAGAVQKIEVQRGQHVKKDQVLLNMEAIDAQAELATASARISQARADLEVIAKGGRATELAEIASGLDRAKLELQNAQRDHDALVRLQAKQAATQSEINAAKDAVDRARIQIKSLEERRAALGAATDRTSAEARLHEAEAAARLAEGRIRMSVVRSPIEGVVYQFDLKAGAYLNAGDLVASVGRLEAVHVNVYVDEPDLGRVRQGMPVEITWDALPGKQWSGSVDKTPTQVVALGARQVGEVVCTIANPRLDLLPGTNVNAEIRSEVVENAVAVSKEALRRQGNQLGVFLLNGERLAWTPVTQGINNTTRSQVQGLKAGDAVALPSERLLKNGMLVRPIFP